MVIIFRENQTSHTFFIVLLEMFQNLNVTRDLLSTSILTRAILDEMSDVLVPSRGPRHRKAPTLLRVTVRLLFTEIRNLSQS